MIAPLRDHSEAPKPGYTPRVGETVTYFNDHGFPRAAIVTGTRDSLVGEQHVRLIMHPTEVHLVVFSPLPRTYHEQHVRLATTADFPDPVHCYAPLEP